MKLLAITLNYKTPRMTLDAVRAALPALARVDGGWRLDVVDNDSQDGSEATLREGVAELSNVRFLQTGHNGGFGFGNNYAIRAALESDDPPDYVYLLNSDAFPSEHAIEALVDYLDAHPDVGIAGSYIHGVDGEPHLTAFRFPSLASEVLGAFRLGALKRVLSDHEVPIIPMPDTTRAVDWLAGASMMIRREVLESVGLFDETFFLYFEETDLCRRARLRGWATHYVVESRVAHVGHGSTGLKDKSKPMPRYWFDSRRHFFRKSYGPAYTWAANAAHAVGLATFKARAGLQRKADTDPTGFLKDFVKYNFVDHRP
ncbi:MAG: glycosyltransferase family 2 protein [Sandaracinaceae bacterium]|nr:glycosyltransferase family 2 protein [Sandaracinaceae bacterium]